MACHINPLDTALAGRLRPPCLDSVRVRHFRLKVIFVKKQIWHQSLGVFRIILHRYLARSVLAVGLVFLAALAEGVGVLAILPLLATVIGEPIQGTGVVAAAFQTINENMGFQPTVAWMLVTIITFITGKAVLNVFAEIQAGYLASRIATDLRLELSDNLIQARWPYFARQPVGELANAYGYESASAIVTCTTWLKVVTASLQVIVYAALALIVSWQITIVVIVYGALMFFLQKGLMRRVFIASNREAMQLRGLTGHVADSLALMKSIKAMAIGDRFLATWQDESEAINTTYRRKIVLLAFLRSAMEPVATLMIVTGILVGFEIYALNFSIILFMVVVFYRLLTRIQILQGSYQQLVDDQTTFWRLRDLIDQVGAARESWPGTEHPSFGRAITFRKVGFRYDGNRIFTDLHLDIVAGRCTAIIGPSGAGKTTILDLLAGLVQADTGQIAVDGVALADIDLKGWRAQIGYVEQDTLLLNKTILENVTLGDPGLTEADAEAALRAAGLWDFVNHKPDRMNTFVGEGGAQLSGGQRQRIAIARAIVRQPSVLILDEATTSLDPETEREVIDSIRTLKGSMTLVVVSHQPAILELADMVYELENGNAV